METTAAKDTRALVLHPDITSETDRRDAHYALEEAVSLAHALPGLEIVGSEVVRLATPRPGMLFGSGKVEELGNGSKPRKSGLF